MVELEKKSSEKLQKRIRKRNRAKKNEQQRAEEETHNVEEEAGDLQKNREKKVKKVKLQGGGKIEEEEEDKRIVIVGKGIMTNESEESYEVANGVSLDETKERMKSQKADRKKKKLKDRLLKEATKADNRGVCYLSRIPPHMDHVRLRQILSQLGEIGRIYLAPEDPEAQVHRKRAGGFRGQLFSEGWVEFAKKSVAKRVADMLNGEQIGGKKKSTIYYDIWNIKYLTKFKWDDLTEEIAYKSAIREQKLNMVLSAAKREKDFYLSKVEKSRAMTEIDERMKKKRKIQEESGSNAEAAPVYPPRAIRQFRQKKSIKNETSQSKPGLSTDVLASVFGGS